MIDLNDKSYDGGGKIFNGNKAGIAENITLSVEKKRPEDKENAPDYKLTLTDAGGATTNLAFWVELKETPHKSVAQQEQLRGKMMKHFLHAIYGEDYVIPTFPDMTALLHGSMKLIHEGVKTGLKFRVFVNFGTSFSVKSFVQPRNWVPVIESMSVPIAETRLIPGDIDAMVTVAADAPPTASADSIMEAKGDDGW